MIEDVQLPFDLGELDAPPAPSLVEKAYRHAIASTHRGDDAPGAVTLEDADAGMVGLALALARAVDQAAAKRDVRGLALVAKELRETSARLQLDPTARGTTSDPIGDLLSQLSQPATSGPAPVGDTP